MSIFQWPFKRKQYAGIGNPRFVGDIVAANEAVIDAMIAICGLGLSDFAIISGLDYTAGPPDSYAPGIFYLNGSFYYISAGFTDGLYLTGNQSDTMSQPFGDGNARNIYTLFSGATTSDPTDASPLFSGNMNQYRIGLKATNTSLNTVLALLATLGNAAFRNIGTISGTVAAGDDGRFGYTVAQINALFAPLANVLLLNNATSFTPTGAYNPATKQYADQAAGMKLIWLGEITSSGSIVTVLGPSGTSIVVTSSRVGTGHYTISHNIGSTNYFVTGIGIDSSGINVLVSPRSYSSKTSTSFDVYLSDDDSANDASFELAIYQYF